VVVGSSGNVWRVLGSWVHGARLSGRGIPGVRGRGLLGLLESAVATTCGGVAGLLLLLLRRVATRGTGVTWGASSWVPGAVIAGVTSIGVGWVCVVGRASVLARLVGFRVAVLDYR
jgi:hypothetical protein